MFCSNSLPVFLLINAFGIWGGVGGLDIHTCGVKSEVHSSRMSFLLAGENTLPSPAPCLEERGHSRPRERQRKEDIPAPLWSGQQERRPSSLLQQHGSGPREGVCPCSCSPETEPLSGVGFLWPLGDPPRRDGGP